MGKKLTEEQIERYHRDGFAYPIDAFAAEEARRYRRAMEEFEAAQGREFTKGQNFKPHLLFTWVDEIVHHPAILDAVEDVVGPDIRLFHLSVWPKNAGDPAYVSWHQDATYFGLEPPLQVTAWVALTDASIEAGCMARTSSASSITPSTARPRTIYCRAARPSRSSSTTAARNPCRCARASSRCITRTWSTIRARTSPPTGASVSASATSRPTRAAPAAHD
jgi:Phytanoyl-CoA dioxygenase (PhyH)